MDKIIILDMGGQYAHLLARRVREIGVYSEIWPSDSSFSKLSSKDVKGIIISGGPSSVYEKNSPKSNPRLFTIKKPILGLCYGHQLMAHNMKGKVTPGKVKEYGIAKLIIKKRSKLFAGLENEEQIWMSHGDSVEQMPPGFNHIGSTDDCMIAAMSDAKRDYYGLQFHPEVTHTPHGKRLLSNFVLQICRAKKGWSMEHFIDNSISSIKKIAGKRNVFLLVSGGVDSVVCFALLNRALGKDRVYGLHIDNGFMRLNESMNVNSALKKLGFTNFHVIDASRDFLDAVRGVAEPEKKRKIIGDKFIKIQQQEVKKLKLDPKKWMLGQGTIYPDTIETKGTKHADLIKTHHNRVPIVQEMISKGLVIEPIKELYKDEVRELGMQLGLPRSIVQRHPFPGPGLAVRCLCCKSAEKINDELRLNREINLHCMKFGIAAKVLPIRSVGVQGDGRTYRHPILLTGNEKGVNYAAIDKLSSELTNRFREVNRVLLLYGINGKADDLIAKENSYLAKNRLDMLREADDIVSKTMDDPKYRLACSKIWQFPVVLVPLGTKGGETIILRPVESKEAMTANWARLPSEFVYSVTEKLMKIKGIDAVFLDVTNKPPATIEWE